MFNTSKSKGMAVDLKKMAHLVWLASGVKISGSRFRVWERWSIGSTNCKANWFSICSDVFAVLVLCGCLGTGSKAKRKKLSVYRSFPPSPVIMSFGYWPKERDHGNKQPKWVSSAGCLGRERYPGHWGLSLREDQTGGTMPLAQNEQAEETQATTLWTRLLIPRPDSGYEVQPAEWSSGRASDLKLVGHGFDLQYGHTKDFLALSFQGWIWGLDQPMFPGSGLPAAHCSPLGETNVASFGLWQSLGL